jgi:hypothetical protein
MRGAALVVAALVLCGGAAAGATPWASAANKVCIAWQARAKAALGKQPTTPQQAFRWAVTSRSLESELLAALTKLHGRTAAANAALAAARRDIAELDVAIGDWKKGDRRSFETLIVRWGNDHRPAAAFKAAGARACAS